MIRLINAESVPRDIAAERVHCADVLTALLVATERCVLGKTTSTRWIAAAVAEGACCGSADPVPTVIAAERIGDADSRAAHEVITSGTASDEATVVTAGALFEATDEISRACVIKSDFETRPNC